MNTNSTTSTQTKATLEILVQPRWLFNRRFATKFTVSLLLLALVTVPWSWAATPVSGIVDDEMWTAAGSPYLVIGDVSVGSLMIQPGVRVQFQGNFVFLVEGFLQVLPYASVGHIGIYRDKKLGQSPRHCE